MNGLPMWAKVVAVIGFPGAVAIWLLWIVTGSMAQNARSVNHMENALTNHVEAIDRVVPLLERICRRLGKTELEREACH